MDQQYQVIARKYRPQNFRDVVGQNAVVTTLKNALKFNRVAHAYLFAGSRGIGKTTLARLFAKALNCEKPSSDHEPCNVCASCTEITSGQSLDVIEIDGASNRGIDDIRQINETVGYAPSHGKYKIYIIDEVHMLTKEAFNALLKTLEEPPPKAKFFFATTEPHKVLPTIISRCQRFDLGRILPSQIITKLEEIAKDQKREVEERALHYIASFAEGSMRDAESLFDQMLCFMTGPITESSVRKALGLVALDHFHALDKAFSECRIAYGFELVEYLFQEGKDLPHFFEQLIDHYRQITLCKILGESSLPSAIASKYVQSARSYTQAQCLYILDYLLSMEPKLQKSVCQRVCLESALIHVIRSKNRIPVEILIRRLSELEQTLTNTSQEQVTDVSPKIESVKKILPFSEKINQMPSLPINKKEVDTPSIEEAPSKQADSPIEEPSSVSTELSSNDETEKKPSLESNEPSSLQPQETSIAKSEELSLKIETPSPALPEKPSLDLMAVPFNPNQLIESPPLKKIEENIIVDAIEKKEQTPPLAKHMSHYDTLMRFAAVELEGSFKHN